MIQALPAMSAGQPGLRVVGVVSPHSPPPSAVSDDLNDEEPHECVRPSIPQSSDLTMATTKEAKKQGGCGSGAPAVSRSAPSTVDGVQDAKQAAAGESTSGRKSPVLNTHSSEPRKQGNPKHRQNDPECELLHQARTAVRAHFDHLRFIQKEANQWTDVYYSLKKELRPKFADDLKKVEELKAKLQSEFTEVKYHMSDLDNGGDRRKAAVNAILSLRDPQSPYKPGEATGMYKEMLPFFAHPPLSASGEMPASAAAAAAPVDQSSQSKTSRGSSPPDAGGEESKGKGPASNESFYSNSSRSDTCSCECDLCLIAGECCWNSLCPPKPDSAAAAPAGPSGVTKLTDAVSDKPDAVADPLLEEKLDRAHALVRAHKDMNAFPLVAAIDSLRRRGVGYTVTHRQYYSLDANAARERAAKDGYPGAPVIVMPVEETDTARYLRYLWRTVGGLCVAYQAYVIGVVPFRLWERYTLGRSIMTSVSADVGSKIAADIVQSVGAQTLHPILATAVDAGVGALRDWVLSKSPLVSYPSVVVAATAILGGAGYLEYKFRTTKKVAVREITSTMVTVYNDVSEIDARADSFTTVALRHPDPVLARFKAEDRWVSRMRVEGAFAPALTFVGEYVASLETAVQVHATLETKCVGSVVDMQAAVDRATAHVLTVNIDKSSPMASEAVMRSIKRGSAKLALAWLLESKSRDPCVTPASDFQ